MMDKTTLLFISRPMFRSYNPKDETLKESQLPKAEPVKSESLKSFKNIDSLDI